MDESTDLVTDHPFQASPWPDTCGYRGEQGDWMCGYGAAEHGESLDP